MKSTLSGIDGLDEGFGAEVCFVDTGTMQGFGKKDAWFLEKACLVVAERLFGFRKDLI